MKTLAQLCQTIGARVPLWTQGVGGNVSMKSADSLWIKASGVRLCDVTTSTGVAKVELAPFREMMLALDRAEPSSIDDAGAEKAYADLLVTCSDKAHGRPSMESGFHALFERQWVAHFHSLASLLMSHHRVKGAPILEPVMPGLELSLELTRHALEPAVLLARHGVILQGDDPDEMLAEWSRWERKFLAEHGYAAVLDTAHAPPPAPLRIYFPDSAVFIDRLMKVIEPRGTNAAGERLYDVGEGAQKRDRDAVELWRATQYLYAACPALEELPLEISSKIGKLPTELFRKAQH